MSVFPSFSAGADIVFGSLAQSSKINDIKSPIETFISALAGGSVLNGDHTSATNITANKNPIVFINASGGNATVNLPSAGSHSLFPIYIKKIDNSVNTVTINRAGSDTIENPDGPIATPTATSVVLRFSGEALLLYPRSTYWQVLDKEWYVPSIRVYKDDAQTITTSSAKVNFNVVNDYPTSSAYDTFNLWDTVNYRYNVRRSGVYLVGGSVTVASGTSSFLQLDAYLNSTSVYQVNFPYDQVATTNAIVGSLPAQQIRATAGDTIQLQANVTAGSRSLFSSGVGRQRFTFFEISYVGKAV